jgi:hypothetical protein
VGGGTMRAFAEEMTGVSAVKAFSFGDSFLLDAVPFGNLLGCG